MPATPWGSHRNCRRGNAIANYLATSDLVVIKNGNPTYMRPPRYMNAIDLTLITQDITLKWETEPDTWGSEHFPIVLSRSRRNNVPRKTKKITNWEKYRQGLANSTADDLLHCIKTSLANSTKTVFYPTSMPVPGLKFLNLRAVRRRAQRRAIRTGLEVDCISYKRISAAHRRHVLKLRRTQWKQFSASLTAHTPVTKVWSALRAIECLPQPSNPLVTLSVSSKREPKDPADELVTELAQVASCNDPRPSLRVSASDGSPTEVATGLRHARESNAFALALFLDVKKAYDSVKHSACLLALTEARITGCLLRFIVDFLSDRKFDVSVSGHISFTNYFQRGVPQGSVLSTTLFNLIMAGIQKRMRHN
ncbi:uncharacterized protein LOC135382894 [Ornithodoros turicata]|uniref:uncharacterized protein LOC135382894 n=1 Tax=Ornithodoros turicata TaxID=34597 RepID=UPI003138DED9